ncbi:DUF6644 family protein [Sinorhizobium meliloti]|uniref:DUF6644 domain-containing protein n=1 Tax=Rhizobium meliloti TaxID=382 RepID=A0A2J0YUJ4_RHIML|nr:DUF6644 family protein [Sinorhizobium meliloti]PJR09917.1 hypothetical protein CEJ86_30360 [Sinorhizobium meliloti]
MLTFAEWIAQTAISQWLQVQGWWFVPALQSIHILAIAVVLSSLLMLNTRLLGLSGSGLTVPQVAQRYLPWLWWGLPILAVTGTLLIVAEPVRSLWNIAFWIKMALLLVALVLTLRFQGYAKIDPAFWENAANKTRIRGYAVLSLIVWVGIVFGGRWIGYVNA